MNLMSRAFTKEDDAGDDMPERPVPSGPNYVTPRGLALLHEEGRALLARKKEAGPDAVKAIDRDLRYIEARITSAIVVPPGASNEVRFGARVTYKDDAGQEKIFQIVGEDEARGDKTKLPWSAPLAHAMLGAKPGDGVSWKSDDGVNQYMIVSVDYPKGS
jgi:transcription elongation GreA/GreB family factor